MSGNTFMTVLSFEIAEREFAYYLIVKFHLELN